MYFRIEKAPDTAVGKLEGIGCRQGNPKGMPCPYFITGRGIRHKKLFPKQIKFKERKR